MLYSLKNVALIAASVALLNPVSAFWRLECHGVAGIARIDPLVDPGDMSKHLHTIKGSSGLSETSTVDDLLNSKCTSCQVKQDKSAYWSAQLYFMHDDGTFELVPEVSGHLTYYKYVPAFVNGQLLEPVALPNGLKIISGTTTRRSFDYAVPDPPRPWTGKDASQDALQQKAIGFNCLNYANPKPEDSLYRHTLPSKDFIDQNCPDGLRLEVLFPICWNGKDLDSEDHKSHMAYSDAGLNGGNCPPGYDTVVNQLFFETIYPVADYKGKSGKFVLSNGDGTGCGNHGDAFIAWDEGVLKNATEQCGSPVSGPGASGVTADCPVFDIVPVDEQAQCKIDLPQLQVKMNFMSDLTALPGDNPVQFVAGPPVAAPPAAAAVVNSSPAPSPAPAAADNKPSPDPSYSVGGSQPEVAGNVLLQATSKPADPKPQAPAPTPAPVANPAPVNPGEKILSTSTYTKDGAVYEVVIVQDVVTVTAEPTPAAVKRHAHVHEHLGRRSHVHHPRRR